MIPIKSKELIIELADEINIPEGDIEKIIDTYYRYVQNNMRDIESIRVMVYKLGTFRVIYRRLVKLINRYEQKLEQYENRKDMRGYAVKMKYKKLLVNLYAAKHEHNREHERKKEKKIERRNYERNKNMEGKG